MQDNTMKIRTISALDTYVVRHPVLRPGRPIETCAMGGDDREDTIHLGAFDVVNDQLVGVATLLVENSPYFPGQKGAQLRGMAVLPSHHRKGIGAELVKALEDLARHRKDEILWMNARVSAQLFYRALGYKEIGPVFDIDRIGPHYVMYRSL
ncbi:MAG: GNAT family N-acetyltransferase [Flavobacteriaceae bacterium]